MDDRKVKRERPVAGLLSAQLRGESVHGEASLVVGGTHDEPVGELWHARRGDVDLVVR